MEQNYDKSASGGHPPPYPYPGGPPGPPAGPPPPMPVTNIAVVQPGFAVPMVIGPHLGPQPGPYTCTTCREQIVTRVETKPTSKTHLFAALLCLLGCWCCVCVPYCVDSCMTVNHYCPNCNAYIGSHNS